MFRRILFVAALISIAPIYSQTKEQLHQSNQNFEQDRIHAKGTYPTSKTFWELYKTPESISEEGPHFDALFDYVSLGTFISFMLIMLGVFLFTTKYNEKRGVKAFYTDGHNEKKYTLVIDIVFFIFLDVVLIYFSIVDTAAYLAAPPTGPDIVRVQAMPQQWIWNFRYPGNDGKFGTADDVVTLNELWLPKGKTVYLQMMSKDVIHGFMVHEVRHQMDAIPGKVTRLWFKPIRNGDYEIACMHLCGTAHYKMKGFMKIVDPKDYETWTKEMSEWSEARYDPDDKATHWGWEWL